MSVLCGSGTIIHPSQTKTFLLIAIDVAQISAEESMKKVELIFIPAPGVGHLVPTLEFAERLLSRNDRLHITILVMKPPSSDHDFVDTYTKSLASNPRIQLVHLPPPKDPPPPELFAKSIVVYMCNLIESYVFDVKVAVADILSASSSSDSVVAGLVLDLLCTSMIDAGKQCGLPSFIYFTGNAGFLALQLYTCSRHDQIGREFRYTDGEYTIPGLVDPVPPQVLPEPLFNRDGEYEACVKIDQRFKDSSGIIVNTFSELEPYAINYFLHDGETPPIYPVGPMLNLRGQDHPDVDQEQLKKIMTWLDKQPQSSVVFLCFGSMGILTPPQVRELAFGLEQSGYRFLWSLRAPQSVKNPEEMLPEGFLERIGERGMICRWAPQVQVLAHEAAGCFISHCGWNSFLESLWYGVPVIPFPLYAEQHLNAFMMTRECALAVELKFEHREDGDLAMAEEVARAVERAMGGDSQVRKNVKEMSEKATKAEMQGGSSSLSIAQFLKDIAQDNN